MLNIKHKYDNICAPVVAVSANVDFSIKFGNLIEYFLHKKDPLMKNFILDRRFNLHLDRCLVKTILMKKNFIIS